MRKELLTAALALGLSACAALPNGKHTPGDPFERVNRSIWKFDDALDHAVIRPIANGYVHVTPAPVRAGVHNFMTNLVYSDTVVNDFLQGQFKDGGNDLGRLLVNSILGIGGIFDPATRLNLARHDRDVGQTLGVWGIHQGPFVMLPFLGPSDVRDGLGLLGDAYLEPYPYIPNPYAEWGLYLGDKFDERVQLLPENKLIDSAYDPYTFVRNAYLQQRDFMVHGSRPTQTPQQMFPGLFQDNGADSGAAPGGPATPAAPASGAAKPATPAPAPPGQ